MHTEIIGTHRTALLSADVFNAMQLRILLFWDLMLHQWVVRSRHFKGM
jgi:hypothetical protein